MPILENIQHEKFAQRVAAGAWAMHAYMFAYPGSKGAKQSGLRLIRRKEIVARINEIRIEIAERLKHCTISEVKSRVEAQQKRWMELHQVIAERAVDPYNALVAGGTTGHLCRRTKVLGSGQWAREVEEFEVDTGLLQAILNLEEQAAQELRQREVPKTEVSVTLTIVERLHAGRARAAAMNLIEPSNLIEAS